MKGTPQSRAIVFQNGILGSDILNGNILAPSEFIAALVDYNKIRAPSAKNPESIVD